MIAATVAHLGMQVLKYQNDVGRKELCRLVVELHSIPKVAKEFPPYHALDDHVNMTRILKRRGQVHDERMLVLRERLQYLFFRFDVLHLVVFDDIRLSQHFDGIVLARADVRGKTDAAEGSGAEDHSGVKVCNRRAL